MRRQHPGDLVESYLENAVKGERRPAIRVALDLFDSGVPEEQVVVGLLAAAQREVGERWHRNELTVADEHIATGVAAAALDALMNESDPSGREGHTVVACAEGDWHALAAEMFGESLRSHGVTVTVLGASTPAELVAEFITRRDGESLAISCSVPIYFPGVVRLVDAAHQLGCPVIVGGRAFGNDSRRAERLGADAWARTAEDAAVIVSGWRAEPPAVTHEATPLDPVALRLSTDSRQLGLSALDGLAARFPPMLDYSERQMARTREDLVFIVQFLAATMLVSDDSVFTEFLDWLQDLLVSRGVPPTALISGLEALRPVIADAGAADAVRLLDIGRHQLHYAIG
ncbi:MAG TPA: cobalamin-dependent protein [Ilumatobacteraceae bacterium]